MISQNVKIDPEFPAPLPEGRRREIVEAATQVFARYGFARVTMADLATAVGMSRTALYPLFASKAAIFDAVVRHHASSSFVRIRSGIGTITPLADKLRFACEETIVSGFEFVRALPDAADMFDLDRPAVQDIYRGIEALLVEILAGTTGRGPFDIELLARTSTAALRAFKQIAADSTDLRRMIDAQIDLIVYRLQPSA